MVEAADAEKVCAICSQPDRLLAAEFGGCPTCALTTEDALPLARAAHGRSRALFDLPEAPPRTNGGVQCTLCGCECQIGEGEWDFCGLRTVRDGRLQHVAGTPERGILHWYRDPLPTNCVAGWVCPGSPQHGKHNLAVFYQSCALDCLNCQNWHFRQVNPLASPGMNATDLVDVADPRTYCVCYFGGDPALQMPHTPWPQPRRWPSAM